MTLTLPATAYAEPLNALSNEGAHLILSDGNDPVIARPITNCGGIRDLSIDWTGNRIIARGLMQEGLVRIVNTSGRVVTYRITPEGKAISEGLNDRTKSLERQIEDLQSQIDGMEERGIAKHLAEERKKSVFYVHPIHDKLTRMESNLLDMLASNPGHCFTKQYLHDTCLNADTEIKIVDVFICKIRKKLKKFLPDVSIRTIWGVGYAIEGESTNDCIIPEMDRED